MKYDHLFGHFIRPYRFWILLSATAGAVCAGTNVFVSDILKKIINMVAVQNLNGMRSIILSGIVVLVAGMIANYATTYLTGYVGSHIVQDIRNQTMNHLMQTKPDYMERAGFGDTIARLTQDIENIRAFTENYLSDCIYVPLMLLVFSIYLIMLQPILFLMTMGPLIILVVLTTKLLTPVKLSQKKYSKMLGAANDNIKEACDGASVIKAFSMEKIMYHRFEKQLLECLKLAKRNDWLQYRVLPLSGLLNDLPMILAMIIGGYQTLKGIITIGELVAFISLLKILIDPLSQVYQLWVNSKSAMANLDRIQAIFDEPVERPNYKFAKAFDEPGNYTNAPVYEMRNVSFSYDANNKVLQNVNITIRQGSRTAFVGMSGSGKSTLLKLLYRHYDNYEGDILFEGKELKGLEPELFRSRLALISQSPYLFPLSIEDNIRIGKKNATQEEVIAAAKLANCHDFIMNQPEGYQTIVDENGTSLSGGQLQRLSIARAVLKNADILLLDEPTSALDAESEKQVNEAITRVSEAGDKTIITVAHRLNTIRDYDQIFLFDHGKIKERGTHQELIERGEQYAEYYKAFEEQKI